MALALAACTTGPAGSLADAQAAVAEGDLKRAQLLVSGYLEEQPQDAAALELSGDVAMRMGNLDLAITQFKNLSAVPGKEQAGSDLLAEAFLANGNTRMAKRSLSDHGIETPRAYSVAVGVALIEGRSNQALETLQEGLERFDDSADLHALDAYLTLQAGDLDGAKAKLKTALGHDANLVDAQLLAGRIALLEQDLPTAKASFENVVAQEPNHQTALLALIAIARDTGDDANLKRLMAQAEQGGKVNPIAVYFAAQMAFENNEVKRAFELLQPIVGQSRTFPALDRLVGLVAARRGQTNEAIISLNRYFSGGGEDRVARLVLAAEQHRNKEHEAAWETVQPLLSDPKSGPQILQLGVSIASALNLKDADALKARIAGAGPDQKFLQAMGQAGAAIKADNWKRADAIYAELLASGHDKEVGLLNNAALAKLELGDGAAATALARKAAKLAPQDAVVLDTLGWVLFKTEGASEEARNLLAMAATKKPGDKTIAQHLGTVSKALSSN